jgi:hypothetical protein
MELLILTSALDRSASAITSASNVTALAGPDAFPQLVAGTTEPITVKHLSAASTFESWSDDPLYTVIASLGKLTTSGLDVYAEATLSDVIADGKGGNLPLTTSRLVDALRNWRFPRSVLTLQITVVDPTGNKRVFAQLPVTVLGTVPSYTSTP